MATIRTRKRGKTWSYSFEVGKNPETGRRKMKEKGGFASQDEAYDAGVEAYADWKHGNIGITSDKVLLDDFFKSWMKNVVKPSVKFGTAYQYERRYLCVISPMLGKMYLQDIRPRNVDTVIRKMAADGKSRETIGGILTLFRSMFKYAVYPAELIASNPALNLSIPHSAPRHVLERRVISRDELDKILATFGANKKYAYFRIPILLGYYAGLRMGETLGLCWEDVDFEKKIISISRQLRRGRTRRENVFTQPKTPTSTRTICMNDALIEELRAWKKRQAEERLKMGSSYQVAYEVGTDRFLKMLPALDGKPDNAIERDLICTRKYGLPISRETLMYHLRKINVNFHSFRHTHATRLIEAGAKPVDVAARLGHADVSITQNLYSHDTEKMARETAALIDKVM